MTKLKLNIFFVKKRKIIFLGIGIICVIVAIFGFSEASSKIAEENPTLFGVAGTLSGAVIGGFFSLMGSALINTKQQRAKQNIKKKAIIYSPLYDELVGNQDEILVQNPYPKHIAFKKEPKTNKLYPQFTAWGRIKGDTRYLEVPQILVKQMEQLENAMYAYLDIRSKVGDEIQRIIDDVFAENGLKKPLLPHIGRELSDEILNNKKTDRYYEIMKIGTREESDSQIRELVDKQIFEKCNENQMVLDTRKCYENWLKIQKETIEMLRLLIKQVSVKYEG